MLEQVSNQSTQGTKKTDFQACSPSGSFLIPPSPLKKKCTVGTLEILQRFPQENFTCPSVSKQQNLLGLGCQMQLSLHVNVHAA